MEKVGLGGVEVDVAPLQIFEREVYERWKEGDYSLELPLGLYPPAMPRTANLADALV